MPRCLELLDDEILPVCQYFAYIETAHGERFNDSAETPVWHGYSEIGGRERNFAMRRVAAPETSIRCSTSCFRQVASPPEGGNSSWPPRRSCQDAKQHAPLFDGRNGASS